MLFLLVLITAGFSAEYKSIYNISSAKQSSLQESVINTISALTKHYEDQGDTYKSVVLVSGNAYKYFIDDIENSPYKDEKNLAAIQKELKPQLEALVKKGLIFEMCTVGMKKHHMLKSDIYSFVTLVFNRNSSLIHWNTKGYLILYVQ
ncbi:MAG TPA: hypothetical protein EYO73_11695 [Sulfurimonas sp.]|nr:hypothetical protein [Sulfurimonas sp.]